ncbi:hypothetical protein K227x_21110 [Rubripirellula lacrimiformis]|uniref:Uncharacterized protein n=1 Tax=Rubripirellula lacrimiformis TaxID=1930273 RepID=A0A517N9A7_9BACT|nr:hypothetical protein [Rubripirellula lacrimiformis]QDT03726.1 hypothetical protein K227x_21110 [Rubripirellula lacrimiformis]
MDFLLYAMLVWGVITVLGHGTWVLIRSMVQFVTGTDRPPAGDVSQRQDLAAARRVVQRLELRGVLDAATATKFQRGIQSLELSGDDRATQSDSSPLAKRAPGNVVPPLRNAAAGTADRGIAYDFCDDEVVEAVLVEPPESPTTSQQQSLAADRQTYDRLDSDQPGVDHPFHASEQEPVAPALSKAEVIGSFLARRNIRWGELVAGMLIVICSIGLVISLWSTLVQTHRAIPSLIFLAANAAIYASGFYTLSRWKLRHTSRAVLLIASLLVPLSVLAGMAASGTEANAIRLGDPVTLIAIAVAALVYGTLVYRGGRALVRRHLAWPFTLAVIGPVVVLPLLPTAVQRMGFDAGWILAIGSIAVAVAVVWVTRVGMKYSDRFQHRLGQPESEPRSSDCIARASFAHVRSRMTVIGLGVFSLAVSIGYAVYSSQLIAQETLGPQFLLLIAIATIPACLAIATAARYLMTTARGALGSMAAAVLLVIGAAAPMTILPAAMTSEAWVWTWAVIFTISAVVIGGVLRQSLMTVIALLPLGLAATLTSPNWMSGLDWANVSMTRRLIGGEPMLVTLTLATVSGIIAAWPGANRYRQWLAIMGFGWIGWAAVMAMVLSVSPPSAMGIVPAAVVTITLLAGAIVGVVLSRSQTRLHQQLGFTLGAAATALTWVSILRPFQFGQGPFMVAMDTKLISTLMQVMAGSAAMGILYCEGLRHWDRRRGMAASGSESALGMPVPSSAAHRWLGMSVSVWGIVSVVACASVRFNASVSTWILGGAVLGLLWANSIRQSTTWIRMTQVVMVALAILIGYRADWDGLFAVQHWQMGRSPWVWAIVLASASAVWSVCRLATGAIIRERWLGRQVADGVCGRIGFVASAKNQSSGMPVTVAFDAAVGFAVLGAVWPYASMLVSVMGNAVVPLSLGWLPIVSLVGLFGVQYVTYAVGKSTSDREQPTAMGSLYGLMIATIVWSVAQGVWALSSVASLAMDEAQTLVLATSLIAVIAWVVGRRRESIRRIQWVAPVSVAVSSLVLMWKFWWLPLSVNELAVAFPVMSVAVWWILGAVVSLDASCKRDDDRLPMLSAGLLAAAIGITASTMALSPVIWVQAASIGLLCWAVGVHHGGPWFGRPNAASVCVPAVHAAIGLATVTALITATTVTIAVLTAMSSMMVFASQTGLLLSVSTILITTWPPLRPLLPSRKLGSMDLWPLGITCVAGQLAHQAYAMGWVTAAQAIPLMGMLWTFGSAAACGRSMLRSWRGNKVRHLELALSVLVTVGLTAVAWQHQIWNLGGATVGAWVALIALLIAGVHVAAVQWSQPSDRAMQVTSRQLGWWVVLAGPTIVWILDLFPATRQVSVTIAAIWVSSWWGIWRISSTRVSELKLTDAKITDPKFHELANAAPDAGLVGILSLALVGEIAWLVSDGGGTGFAGLAGVASGLRLLTYGAIPIIGWLTLSQRVRSGNLLLLAVSAVTLVAVHVVNLFDTTMQIRWMVAALSTGIAIAMMSHWLPWLVRSGGLNASSPDMRVLAQERLRHWSLAAFRIASANGCLAIFAAVFMIVYEVADQQTAWVTQLTILSVAMSGWAIAVLADLTDRTRLRHVAVASVMITVGLLASVESVQSSHPVLETSMRWLVASVLATATWLIAFPKLLGDRIAVRWSDAFRGGAITAAVAGIASLMVMLTIEAILRSEDRTGGISQVMVIGVAVTLAVMSGLSGWIGLVSRPGSHWQTKWQLSDSTRRGLVVAAQGIAALCWLHLFLCKSPLAVLGLRQYWPLIVMVLAFVSVGATEWASRRGDQVIAGVLKQSALYLPLIPIFGFWISLGTSDQSAWKFIGDTVRYDVVLVVGALYYAGLSTIWKSVFPRISAVVMGNAALWMLLAQKPGWGFLMHPQAWIIPPAVCVLVVTHFYRNRISGQAAAGIRYAATLVIYVSSTADMLIGQIGTSLSGPIVLVGLALIGMMAGVVLRVGPFLYLGAIFVFLGSASMVRHAQQSIDAVWPWWVFGITTGMLLLVGLTLLEKNKSRLRNYARSLNG